VTTYIKSAGDNSERSKDPIRNAMSAMMMAMGNETMEAAGGVVDIGTLSASLSPPGNFKKLLDGRRDADVDIGGDEDPEELGGVFVVFHDAVEANRVNGAEYELNKPKRPLGVVFAI
jgi:hypothetical protein